jgi:transcription-repair coupling factor (superfamily II helicase)
MRQAIAELRAEGLDVEGLSESEAQTLKEQNFIDDAVIDIEMLAELPDSYVRQPAEKIKLYRELDSLSREEDLLAFEGRLVDRFGAMPEAAKELLNVVCLRWEAVRLGMERVKVKNGLMIVQFVGDDNSPYYKSEVFMTLLKKITAQPDRFVLKQRNNRLAMTVRRVADVAEAVSVLKNL